MVASDLDSSSSPFIKQLASSNRTTRDKALTSLRTYIRRPTPFTPLECLKLWKGLFYSMWMSDKPRNQQALARDLASLLAETSTTTNTLTFADAFWKTMAREWSGIDALRMDKFLYLVRCVVNKGFELCARGGWGDGEVVEGYLGILEGTPLEARDHRIPNGLRYHVIDVYVDELEKVDGERTAPLEKMLRPLRRLGKRTPTKTVRERVQETLDDERLKDWTGKESVKDAEDSDDDFEGFDD